MPLAAVMAAFAAPAFAQAPALDGNSLTWLAGSRVHTNADGSKVYEAFIGPINGVMTGTALSATGLDQPDTEYHKLGPGGGWQVGPVGGQQPLGHGLDLHTLKDPREG